MAATTTINSPNFGFDPDEVAVAVEDPAGNITLSTYGTDTTVTRTALGSYSVTVTIEFPGTYTYWWTGTGVDGGGGSVTF